MKTAALLACHEMTPRLAKFYAALLAAFFLPLYAFGSQLLGRYLLGVLPVMVVLGIAARLVLSAWQEGSENRKQANTGEHAYGFAGNELLAFSDDSGQIWIRPRMCATCCNLSAVTDG